jgi:hypothetical protein
MMMIVSASLKYFVVLCWRDMYEDYVCGIGCAKLCFYIREHSDDAILYCRKIFRKVTDKLIVKTADSTILSQFHPPHTIILPFPSWFCKWSLSNRCSHQNSVHIPSISHARHVPNPS